MKISRVCWCGRRSEIDLTDTEYEKYCEWRSGRCYIQDIGTLNACEREFIKTGMCRKCQRDIFNNDRTDRVKISQ